MSARRIRAVGAALGAMCVLAVASIVSAAEPTAGEKLYVEKCGMCHRAGGMGTALLTRRVKPEVAELEKRTDLTPQLIDVAIRSGIGNMPRISRAEVSDAQLKTIAAYLVK